MQHFPNSVPPAGSPGSDPSADALVAAQRRVLADRTAQRAAGVSWRGGPGAPAPVDPGLLAVVRSFGASLESADQYSIGHSDRVAAYAAAAGAALGLGRAEIDAVRLGAYLHDVGKIRVAPAIRSKLGRLSDAERGIMRMHPVWALEILEDVELPVDVRPYVRWHHERHDGSGYPDGLEGDAIPRGAALIGMADTYDALTSPRSYQPVMSGSSALALMQARRGWWAPELFDAFCRAAEEMPPAQP